MFSATKRPSDAADPAAKRQRLASAALWTESHRPHVVGDLVGPAAALAHQLVAWLREPIPKRTRSVLLSGPPGVGKTTLVYACCRTTGHDVVELNASDVRSKKHIQERMRGIFQTSRPLCLLMDEVDGMSVGDQGGMAELVAVIKTATVAIVCTCNDRERAKPLIAHSLDLRVSAPAAADIARRLVYVAKAESLTIAPAAIGKLAAAARGDMRQAVQLLQTWGATAPTTATVHRDSEVSLDVAYAKVRRGTLDEALVHCDADLMSFYAFENYFAGATDSTATLAEIARAADCLSIADLAERDYSLTASHAVLSTVAPLRMVTSSVAAGRRPAFPQMLGKISHGNKMLRLRRDLPLLVHRDMMQRLAEVLVVGDVQATLAVMEAYGLTRADWDTLVVEFGGKMEVPVRVPDGKFKAALTLAYKKLHPPEDATPRKTTTRKKK